jgi:hypothetical protein
MMDKLPGCARVRLPPEVGNAELSGVRRAAWAAYVRSCTPSLRMTFAQLGPDRFWFRPSSTNSALIRPARPGAMLRLPVLPHQASSPAFWGQQHPVTIALGMKISRAATESGSLQAATATALLLWRDALIVRAAMFEVSRNRRGRINFPGWWA